MTLSSKPLFTTPSKGGRGKSTAARFLVACLRERKANPLPLDPDDEIKAIRRFLPKTLPVEIKKKSSHDILVQKVLSADHPLILVDLEAGRGPGTLDWFLDVPFGDLRSLGVRFVCMGSITSSPDGVQSFLNWVSILKEQVSYLVLKNLKDGECLPDYETTSAAVCFREQLVPHHLTLPQLDEEYHTELERLNLIISEFLDRCSGISARGQQAHRAPSLRSGSQSPFAEPPTQNLSGVGQGAGFAPADSSLAGFPTRSELLKWKEG